MYASIRTYRFRTGTIDELMHRVDRDFAEALAQEPGFVAYQAIDTGDGTVTSISIFRDEEQAERSNQLAAAWVADELAEFGIERTSLMHGEVMVGRAVSDLLEPAHH
jgi:quinol monooxygenase YgiN